MYEQLKQKSVVKRISELYAMGLSFEDIAKEINEKFQPNEKANERVIEGIVNSFSITSNEFLKSDEKIANLYNETLMSIISEGKENIVILKGLRDYLMEKLDKLKSDPEMNEQKIMTYKKELEGTIRTISDGLKTVDTLIGRLENQKKEVTINTAQISHEVVKALKDYERMGMIKINPEFKNSPLFTYKGTETTE
jgi:hypothetical protein